jgi:pilus assembly protein Flp/PilA
MAPAAFAPTASIWRPVSLPRRASVGARPTFQPFCLIFSRSPNLTFDKWLYESSSSDPHTATRTASVLGARELFMSQLVARFWKDQSGATAIEYGLIAAGISVVIIAVVNGIGTKLNTTFGSISTQLK